MQMRQSEAETRKGGEGKKVWTTSADDVDSWEEQFEHYPEAPLQRDKLLFGQKSILLYLL